VDESQAVLHERIKQLEAEFSHQQRDKDHYKADYEQKIHDLETIIQEMTTVHTTEMQAKQKSIQQLEESLDEVDHESISANREAEKTVAELRASLDSLRAHFDDATAKNHQLQQASLQTTHEHSLEVQRLNAQISQQAITIAELHSSMNSSHDEHERAKKGMKEEMEILRSDNAQLSASIQTLHSLEKQREQDPNSQTVMRNGWGVFMCSYLCLSVCLCLFFVPGCVYVC
jgi:chromosome segregation ATPase